MTMLQWMLQTDGGVVGLILRITLAVVIFPHGAQKVLGWFGGSGFKGSMKHFTDSGIPTLFCLSGDCCRVPRSSRAGCRLLDAHRRVRHRLCDAGCYHHSPLAKRLFHELVR